MAAQETQLQRYIIMRNNTKLNIQNLRKSHLLSSGAGNMVLDFTCNIVALYEKEEINNVNSAYL